MEFNERFDRCCNPFNLDNHKKSKGLRSASENTQKKLGLTSKHKLCSGCRRKVTSLTIEESSEEPFDHLENIGNDNDHTMDDNGDDNVDDDDNSDGTEIQQSLETLSFCSDVIQSQSTSVSEVSIETQLPVVNEALKLLNQSPILLKKFNNQPFLKRKINKICCNLQSKLLITTDCESNLEANNEDFSNLIERLKVKYHNDATSRTEKIQILTLLPPDWSNRKMSDVMNAPRSMVAVAKNLLETNGVLSKPESKLGRPISDEIKLKVSGFYTDDEMSVNMPGLKDFVSIRNDAGQRVQIQKRLVLSNLKELYQRFREEYPDIKIGFSKFASLRPKNCVLAGTSGTHTICVCVMHQNIKLMMLGAGLKSLTQHTTRPLNHYNDCLSLVMCEHPTPQCYYRKCSACPGSEKLKDILYEILDENDLDTLTYKYWISKPRTTLETVVKSSSDFIDEFCDDLNILLPHSFIAKEQAVFMKLLKNSLEEDEFLIVCDFAENYAFVVQNAASGFHWNNDSSTIFPVVVYFKADNDLRHRSLVIISDSDKHDAVAVHVFTKIVTNFVKNISENAEKIYYFSDGAPQQFKNFKNFLNLYHHEDDFGIPAEWHFFATAHGKGPCDGIGGTVKRMAARASLQLPVDQQIITPRGLYEWASKSQNLPNISVAFSSVEDYNLAETKLISRFKSTTTIKGTQKLHCVIPNKDGTLILKDYSNSSEFRVHKLFKRQRK